ncbi:carboxypeptidase inhibitor SmCI-like [Lacerta agilis]|uniref:carboxypeptidase inhibitor SmCI-like n=1 Tax=Lacerta agilis TaxID=80427 RepID=UPI0014195A92|nr:carboxypeptidase inhibitor SmCI-like [Lacerta agilis]
MQCGPFILLSLIVGLFMPWPELLGISASNTDSLPDICKLPKKLGRCASLYRYYFFNIETMKCDQLSSAGCILNENNFMTQAACVFECERFDSLPDKCKLPPKVGRCRGSFLRFSFNTETLKCEEFIFGGCGQNENNFLNETECYQECGRFGKNKYSLPDKCKLPLKVGRCKGSFPRFSFNNETLKCEEFFFGGCGANENNFLNETECYQECGRFVRRTGQMANGFLLSDEPHQFRGEDMRLLQMI